MHGLQYDDGRAGKGNALALILAAHAIWASTMRWSTMRLCARACHVWGFTASRAAKKELVFKVCGFELQQLVRCLTRSIANL